MVVHFSEKNQTAHDAPYALLSDQTRNFNDLLHDMLYFDSCHELLLGLRYEHIQCVRKCAPGDVQISSRISFVTRVSIHDHPMHVLRDARTSFSRPTAVPNSSFHHSPRVPPPQTRPHKRSQQCTADGYMQVCFGKHATNRDQLSSLARSLAWKEDNKWALSPA